MLEIVEEAFNFRCNLRLNQEFHQIITRVLLGLPDLPKTTWLRCFQITHCLPWFLINNHWFKNSYLQNQQVNIWNILCLLFSRKWWMFLIFMMQSMNITVESNSGWTRRSYLQRNKVNCLERTSKLQWNLKK